MATGREGRRVQGGLLAGHFKAGRIFTPALLAIPGMRTNDWIREDAPDLLWAMVAVWSHGDASARLISDAQRDVIAAISSEVLDETGARLDGRLTSLDRFPEESRSAVVDALEPYAAELFPRSLKIGLSMYPDPPGNWLLGSLNPGSDANDEDDVEALQAIASAIVHAAADDSANALVKTATLGWLIHRERVGLPAEVIDLLRDYPTDPEKRPMAESMLLSMFGALKLADEAGDSRIGDARISWATRFWRRNWELTTCIVRYPIAPDEVLDVPIDEDVTQGASLRAAAETGLESLRELYQAFITTAINPMLEVDLYSPEKHEVLTGLVARGYRSAVVALGSPAGWTGEHASSVMRLLAESLIVMRWLVEQDDPEIYLKYQSYGRGKLKLMRRRASEFGERYEGDPPQFVQDMLASLERGTGGEWGEELQEVSLESNFAGISLRQMASEVGEEDEYEYVFQPASGATHGEWWAIEDYAMQPCVNPLHLFHKVPSLGSVAVNPMFPGLLVAKMEDLVNLALAALGASRADDQAKE